MALVPRGNVSGNSDARNILKHGAGRKESKIVGINLEVAGRAELRPEKEKVQSPSHLGRKREASYKYGGEVLCPPSGQAHRRMMIASFPANTKRKAICLGAGATGKLTWQRGSCLMRWSLSVARFVESQSPEFGRLQLGSERPPIFQPKRNKPPWWIQATGSWELAGKMRLLRWKLGS